MSADDVLNADLLPGTLLLQSSESNGSNSSSPGKWDDAFATMNYHRRMMNEYLCRSYVAGEILGVSPVDTIDRRSGKPAKKRPDPPSMLHDPGNSNYNSWLSRATTLEDIYRNHGDVDLQGEEDASTDADGHPSGLGDYDGEVTGYAVAPVEKAHGYNKVAATGYGGSGYMPPPYHPHYMQDKGSDKAMALKDLFELALTAIAFLSFAMFLVNLVVSCFLNQMQNNGAMMTTVATIRVRRASQRRTDEDRAAAFVLAALDAVQERRGACLQRALCLANSDARRLPSRQRPWMPFFSFGVSWVAGRVLPNTKRMDLLHAAVLGLGGADCAHTYQSCNVADLMSKKSKRYRRKRHGDTE